MRIWPILLGTVALMSPELAGATTVFDSVDINPAAFNSGAQGTNTSWDWVDLTANGPLASGFSVSSQQALASVSLGTSAPPCTTTAGWLLYCFCLTVGAPRPLQPTRVSQPSPEAP